MKQSSTIDLTQIDPSSLKEWEAQKIKAILPKLAGLERIIKATKSRAKSLLEEDPDIFNGEWILKEGAIDRRIIDEEKFLTNMLQVQDAFERFPITVSDLLEISTFPIGKAEGLLKEKLGYTQEMAKEFIEGMGDEVIFIGRKAPALKDNRK